jgi:hypothetical protein
VWCTKVAGKEDSLWSSSGLFDAAFQVGRTEYVPGGLQADLQAGRLIGFYATPVAVFKRLYLLFDDCEELFNLPSVTSKADLQGIFQDGRQEQGRGLTAKDWPFEPGREQVGEAANVVDVDVSDDQAAQVVYGKIDLERSVSLFTLKDTAVNQKATASW